MIGIVMLVLASSNWAKSRAKPFWGVNEHDIPSVWRQKEKIIQAAAATSRYRSPEANSIARAIFVFSTSRTQANHSCFCLGYVEQKQETQSSIWMDASRMSRCNSALIHLGYPEILLVNFFCVFCMNEYLLYQCAFHQMFFCQISITRLPSVHSI